LRYESYLETLRLAQWGRQGESLSIGRQVVIHGGYVDVYQSEGLEYGTAEEQYPIPREVPVTGAPPLLTGAVPLGTVDDAWKNGGVLAIRNDSAYPATIRALNIIVEGAD
jgi:hypothetical protein